jgi:hypothetical protein
MITQKIKLAFVIFVISIAYSASSVLTADAAETIVCHNVDHNYFTLTLLPAEPLQPHLDHGDFLGECVDTDSDGIIDLIDNCTTVPNSDQTDTDGDGIGDVCDSTPTDPDTDDDSIIDGVDNCPFTPNSDQTDTDGDGIGNVCELELELELETESLSELELEDNDGGDNAWDTRPTFGVSHETREDIVVENGFRFNGESFDIVDNHHTPFDEHSIELGKVNLFAATVYADKDLKVQEFLFGVPEIGMGHLAEMRVEVWFDYAGEIKDYKVNQDSEIIDRASLIVTHQKVKCKEKDVEEKCDTTFMSAVFLEPLKDKTMAIKAIDFKLRDQTTYLNDGFDVSGDSLNPMNTMMIPSTVKYEGLIKVTQNEKYSKYWTTEDGRTFEMNSFGSFKQINQKFNGIQDTGKPDKRVHSGFTRIIEFEAERALKVFDASKLSGDDFK